MYAGRWLWVCDHALVTSTPTDPFDFGSVRHAYDTVAEDYATYLPDTRAEAPLDLAMIDAFAEAVTSGDDPRALDAGCGAGRMSPYSPTAAVWSRESTCPRHDRDGTARPSRPGFTVGSLTELPYPDGQFAGLMLWYSIIHMPPAGFPRIFAEAARVLRPGGHLLAGFQSGDGTRDVSGNYRRFGHDIRLERHLYTADHVASQLEAVGLREVCRLVRRAQGTERDDQAVLLVKAD